MLPGMKQDARKLSRVSLTDLRRRAVASVQDGHTPDEVAETLGISRAAVFGWLARYRAGGWDALNARRRGGRPPKLSGSQMQWIYQTVTEKNPLQMKFTFALWTLDMVRRLIRRHLRIMLSRSSVGRLMDQLGLSAQRPLWRAYQQNPAAVAKWLRDEYPRICEAAKQARALIFFADEAGVRSDAHSGTTWAPRGKTPIVSTTGARFGMNLISAVSRTGQMHFAVVEGRVTAEVFVEYLRRLLHGRRRPVFLVVDGHPTHKSAMVRRFVESVSGRLQLFFLPPYSPELNPDELAWNDLKNHILGRMSITGPDQMRRAVLSRLRWMQKSPNHVASFFYAPETRYAA
jgi:transposase